MKHTFSLAALLVLAGTQCSFGQVATLIDPGFEIGRTSDPSIPKYWQTYNGAVRRFTGDGILPASVVPHGGTAVLELPPGNDFCGASTNVFNGATGFYYDPQYAYGCGPATFQAYYLIPTNKPITKQAAGMKMEFRRCNTSIYDHFEALDIQGVQFATGLWTAKSITVTQADWDYLFNYYNTGNPWPDAPECPGTVGPISVSLLPERFGIDTTDTGTIYWDDVSFVQDTTATDSPDIKMWDDKNVTAYAKRNAGVVEPNIPVYLHEINPSRNFTSRIGAGCSPLSTYNIIEISDAVTGTGGFPLTFADIVANGYVRVAVQKADGTSTPFGTSIVTDPAYRANGGALGTVPTMTGATLNATWVPQVPFPGGPAQRANPFTVTNTGTFPTGTITCTKSYPDPVVGASEVDITYTWTATSSFTLPTGRGNDAFRLVWLSSMLANLASGQYDGNYLSVTDPSNNTRTIRLADSPRGAYLYASPQPIAVGGSFTLYKDTSATWNAGSPSMTVQLVSITGATGLGVQGYLDTSTNPNNDSLSVWLEWTGAPATVNSGTVISATFKVFATAETAKGDANHDGVINCADVDALLAIYNKSSSFAGFNAYVDMNNDGVINLADYNALVAITGPGCSPAPSSCPGDVNGDSIVNTLDPRSLLSLFGVSVSPATQGDLNGDGIVNTVDLGQLLSHFGVPC